MPDTTFPDRTDPFPAILMVALISIGGLTAATAPEAKYQVLIERDVKIGMRDRVELLADVYHPCKNGKAVPGTFPVILIRTSYNKETRPISFVPNQDYFVERGY